MRFSTFYCSGVSVTSSGWLLGAGVWSDPRPGRAWFDRVVRFESPDCSKRIANALAELDVLRALSQSPPALKRFRTHAPVCG